MAHKILCFGDSNTYGYDPRSCLGGRYPDSVRWTALLEAAGWDGALSVAERDRLSEAFILERVSCGG